MMKKFAIFPFSNVPVKSEIPHKLAGLIVKDASASFSESPLAMHLSKFLWNSLTSHPDVVKESDLDLTTYCVSCGIALGPRIAFRHMEKCWAKVSSRNTEKIVAFF